MKRSAAIDGSCIHSRAFAPAVLPGHQSSHDSGDS